MFLSLHGISLSRQHAAGSTPAAPADDDAKVRAEKPSDDAGTDSAAEDAAPVDGPAPAKRSEPPAPHEGTPVADSGDAPAARRKRPDDDLARQTRSLVREMQRMSERVNSRYSEWLHAVGKNDETTRAAVAAMRHLVDEAIPDAQDAVATAVGMDDLAGSVMPAGIERERAVDEGTCKS